MVSGSTVVYAGSRVRLTSAPSIFLFALCCVISGCSGCRSEESTADAGLAALADVLFSGCAAVVRGPSGPVCELGESRTLRVVMPDGVRSIEAPREADHVTVEGTASGKPARFTLAIASARKTAWLDEAKAARARGDLAHATEIARPHATAVDPVERALAEGMLARIALAGGRAEEAFPHFRRAIELHRAAGRVSDAADDSFALAFALHQRSRRYDEARAVLDAAKGELALYPEGRAREPYYRGILAAETGDHRGALAMLREATRLADELGMTKLARNARSSTALEMQELGRAKEALVLLRDLEKELADGAPCERAEAANNVGWGALLVEDDDARAPLERAIAIEGCADAYVRSFALANLARVALREGDLDAAERRLAEARAAVKEPRGVERIAHLEIEGRIDLARGRAARALARFDDALAFARAAVLPLPEWSALTARADALEALGKKSEAAATLLEAERVLDDAALLVPLGEGRAAFVADRSRSARAAVDLLVRLGRAGDAARVARRSRARVLAGVERALRIASLSPPERARWDDAVRAFRAARAELDAAAANDWKLAADDLKNTVDQRRGRERDLRTALEAAMAVLSKSAPVDGDDATLAEGDVELVVHPTAKGWIAIARGDRGATAWPVPEPSRPAGELARALLDPLATTLDRARRLRVRAYGGWRTVDVHALPFRDRPLVATLAVDYPVGLAARRRRDASDGVVVVGDPTGDLPSAGDEARAVAKLLSPEARVTLLVRDDASSDRLGAALRGASTFHYAGHGVYAGREGWESALPLAHGSRLTVADVLAIAPAPSRVVLSGCDAAKSEGDAEGLGLAQAFVAAGADEVLAPVRPVSDALAAKLAARVHGGRTSLADALRAASLALHAEDAQADWAAFRVLAP